MLKIRRYQPEDKETVIKLHFDGITQMHDDIPRPYNPLFDSDMDNIEGVYLNNGGDFIIGTVNDEIVAMGAIRKFSETCGEIKRIRVRRDCQRKGYGEMIALELISIAEKLSYKELILDTLPDNLPAKRLFEKLGFRESRRGKAGLYDIVYYIKRLNKEDKQDGHGF